MRPHPPQIIGFPRESGPERRTILTPTLARSLTAAGFDIHAEPGTGEGIFIADTTYEQAGVRLATADEVWAAPLVLRYKSPDPGDLTRLQPGQHIGALFHAEGNVDLLAALMSTKANAWSYEFLSDNGQFPLGRPGGHIAGVQAVLAGTQAMQHPAGRGVLPSGLPGAEPANVVVIGSGNVGRAATLTAAQLGARVTVLTSGPNSRDDYQAAAPTGVTVLANDRTVLREALASADLVIGAILISTYDTPPMIHTNDLHHMRRGAVIVDATCGYGPGYLPTAGPVQKPGDPPRIVRGVLHIKVDAWPALVPVTASHAYAANAAPYLVRLAETVLRGRDDTAVRTAQIAADGVLAHPVVRQHARFYGITR
ncbi:NAD(P)-dependent oxidoreductase [Micromonospora rifamycinica]|uniref:NAD(P)-dependent oxidoreductase n=1 Tax=Micromonospora rifamycinica TaxID=291594 RepID=UPI00341AEFD8